MDKGNILLLLSVVVIGVGASSNGKLVQEGKYTFRADSGHFLGFCAKCFEFLPYYTPSIKASYSKSSDIVWTLKNDRGFVVIKLGSEPLTLCNEQQCQIPESIKGNHYVNNYVTTGSYHNPEKQLWEPQKLSNGKWVFKARNNKYLGRCSFAPNRKEPDFPCANYDKYNPKAHWILTKVG